MTTPLYPLAALIGQEELKLALLLNAVNPAIGGLLVRGEKGTAKSTAVRALAELLPEIEVVSGCRFSRGPAHRDELCRECRECDDNPGTSRRAARLVNLPLNTTEDRVTGGIDFSASLKRGRAVLQAGLLAEAHRGILYIDEVNLLDDHITDLILNAAASGRNIIEREGISVNHPARFILIGTMNPEEGELRPQLLDRFGLCLEVKGCDELEQRVALLARREEFDRDPLRFRAAFQAESDDLHRRIKAGRRQLHKVRIPATRRIFIGELCAANNVAGHRADLILEQTALALAALWGESEVRTEHIRRAAPMVLRHRQREAQPPMPPETPPEHNNRHETEKPENQELPEEKGEESREPQQNTGRPPDSSQEREQSAAERQEEQAETELDGSEQDQPPGLKDTIFEIGPSFRVKKITTIRDRTTRRGSGRRSRSMVSQKQGRYSRAGRHGLRGDIAMDATIRAAAPYQKNRRGNLAVKLDPQDFRYKIREKRLGNLLLFLVDASGSMGARGRMAASKGAIMSLLLDAYQKRDKVSMTSFRRGEAKINLPVTSSVEMAGKLLAEMPVGGRTPLSAGLIKSYEQVRNFLSREPTGRPIVIILTDGKGNVSLGAARPVDEMLKIAAAMTAEKRAKYIVVDTEDEGLVTFGLARRLAGALEADYFKIKDIKAEELVNIVREKQ
ncbi:magnesium chelatase subunit D family protein [Desulfobacterota bacterium M19]